uniref:ATP-binding protein n=1 Tax=Microbispora cellulosiformans TaxID=2614688 RepID=UPI00177AA364|nr:ATP-binding protein [Microbispora cellulosiformans]
MTKAVGLLGRIDLPGEAASVRGARHYVRVLLAGTGHPRADDAVLLVSELVANAVRHSDSRLPGGQVTLAVGRHSGTLHIDVIDAGSATHAPHVRAGTDAETCSGRGLWLVQELAAAWGWHESAAGRVVWFQLTLSSPSTPS